MLLLKCGLPNNSRQEYRNDFFPLSSAQPFNSRDPNLGDYLPLKLYSYVYGSKLVMCLPLITKTPVTRKLSSPNIETAAAGKGSTSQSNNVRLYVYSASLDEVMQLLVEM